jgi:hypothetical protein
MRRQHILAVLQVIVRNVRIISGTKNQENCTTRSVVARGTYMHRIFLMIQFRLLFIFLRHLHHTDTNLADETQRSYSDIISGSNVGVHKTHEPPFVELGKQLGNH